MKYQVVITSAKLLTLQDLEQQHPAATKAWVDLTENGKKVMWDLQVKVTKNGKFAPGLQSGNFRVLTYASTITGVFQRKLELMETVKANVNENKPTDYHVQAFAKPEQAAAVCVLDPPNEVSLATVSCSPLKTV